MTTHRYIGCCPRCRTPLEQYVAVSYIEVTQRIDAPLSHARPASCPRCETVVALHYCSGLFDLRQLALTDPVVHQALTLYGNGLSLEAALTSAILVLSDEVQRLKDQLYTALAQHATLNVPMILPDKDGPRS